MFVRSVSLFAPQAPEPPRIPKKIFILRNNDIGDLLVVTPLFDALKKEFPNTEILAGVGSWNREVLIGNPNVSNILEVNAPWHNNFIRSQGLLGALQYIYRSDEAKVLERVHADVGIDVLGSGFGSLLLMRARIPYRLGVRGYGGGASSTQSSIDYRSEEHVGRQALRFAELLGCRHPPENRPQIFLDRPPLPNGAVVIAPGVGLAEKGWPGDHFIKLIGLLSHERIIVIGSKKDMALASRICGNCPKARDLSGKLTLRESFAIIGGAKLVICNSSMAMHASAAFRIPTVVLLGEPYPSAAQHHRQWGYSETVMLGRDHGHNRIFSPQEAATKILGLLKCLS
jgi:ADP-heptose:LPS heptosyltransferase